MYANNSLIFTKNKNLKRYTQIGNGIQISQNNGRYNVTEVRVRWGCSDKTFKE